MHGREKINNVIVSIDDADMENENENENNLSGIGGMQGAVNTACVSNLAAYNPDFEVNNSSIDLDMYVSGYTGLMRINRLVFLAEHCPLLRIDALRLALNYCMETYNTQLYITIHKQLTEAFSKLYFFIVI